MHQTLEKHVEHFCSNHKCKKPRDGEDVTSHFAAQFHYISWDCQRCGEETWFKTPFHSSGEVNMTKVFK
ncbi:hypothetical protein ACFL1B_03540 [Nanoarchaeota archaeon]